MSNSNSFGASRLASTLTRRIIIGVLVLAVPTIVWSGLDVRGAGTPRLSSAALAKVEASKPRQQLRCWQHGRLLLEENDLEVPSESSSYVLKLRRAGGDRSPIYLVETNTTTCLIKQAGAESSPGAINP